MYRGLDNLLTSDANTVNAIDCLQEIVCFVDDHDVTFEINVASPASVFVQQGLVRQGYELWAGLEACLRLWQWLQRCYQMRDTVSISTIIIIKLQILNQLNNNPQYILK